MPDPLWHIPPLEVRAPRALLDGGLALLEGLASDPRPVLRWYRSAATAIVLGRGQQLPDDAPGSGVEILSRHSGGGAVLMDPSLLSLDIVMPPDHPLLAGGLPAVFDRVGDAWAMALTGLGVPDLAVHRLASTASRRGTQRQRLLAAVCYATPGRGEVLAGGRKLVGLAQRRRRQGALVQCGLLRRWEPASLLSALGADPADPEITAAAVGLDELGCGDLVDAEIVSAVSAALIGG
jgi:lipoate-protein ligase A